MSIQETKTTKSGDKITSENAKLKQDLRQLKQQLEHQEINNRQLHMALHEIAQLSGVAEHMDEFYQDLHQVLRRLMYAENFYIALFNEEFDKVKFAYFADIQDTLAEEEKGYIPFEQFEKTLTGHLFRTQQALLADQDMMIHLNKTLGVEYRGSASVDWLGVPLIQDGRMIGTLVVQSYSEEHRFTEQEKELLIFVCQHIASALGRLSSRDKLLTANAEMEKRVELRTKELKNINEELNNEIQFRRKAEHLQHSLYQIAELSSSTQSIEEFYKASHDIVSSLMYAKNFYIALYDDTDDEIRFAYLVDEQDTTPAPRTLNSDLDFELQPLTERVLLSGKAQLIRDCDSVGTSGRSRIGSPPKSWLGVPLQATGRIFGVLAVQSYEHRDLYSEQEKEVLTFVSQHIATAIQRVGDAESIRQAHVQLQQANDELEKRVEERTAELSNANASLQNMLTERKEIHKKLAHDAFHDSLTDLPNRALFEDRLQHAIDRFKRHSNQHFAVLFLDLDRFKVVNDSLGHLAGDTLLKEVAKCLCKEVRPGDTVARLGGDEFCILLEPLSNEQEAIQVANRLLDKISQPFVLMGQQIFTSTSIGIAISSHNYATTNEVLRDADAAMYFAKSKGKATYALFDDAMHKFAVNRLQQENDLRQAVDSSQIEVFYQPIINLETMAIESFEALARWKHPELGMVSPTDFIPIAEETGLINALGEQILRQATLQTQKWRTKFPQLQQLSINVNLSSKQIEQADLLDKIDRCLADSGLPGENLKLEVTEGILIENFSRAKEIFDEFDKRNIKIMLDDFGTGYSSLSYLHQFHMHTLKIDRSFVGMMEHDAKKYTLVQTINTMAKQLHVRVVAEGVENEKHVKMLKDIGVDYAQGFYYGKPMQADEAEAQLTWQEVG